MNIDMFKPDSIMDDDNNARTGLLDTCIAGQFGRISLPAR